MSIKGIDVSEHQGKINWDKVKASGIKFAILRCGFGMDQENQDDKYFSRNAEECERLGIPYGVYLYSYANTIEKAKSEAEHVLRLIKKYKPGLGIWYDLEDKIQSNLAKKTLSNIITTFCDKIENKGYSVGVYANLNWLNNKIDSNIRKRYKIWVAQYNNECQYKGNYLMWQYSSSGKVDGISGKVDMNYLYDESVFKIDTNKNSNTSSSKYIKNSKVLEWQKTINKVYGEKLDLDSTFGPDCERTALKHYLHYTNPIIKNNYVLFIQKIFNEKGYKLIRDRMFGPDCEKKTIKFQKDKKITQDGCVGPQVVKLLLK